MNFAESTIRKITKAENFDLRAIFGCLFALSIWQSPLLILQGMKDAPNRKWVKPSASVSGPDTITVTGDTKEVQMLGTPGAQVWTHVAPFKWEVTIGNGRSPQDAADAINTWDGKMK
jgi:hypothetical protein